ncbi:MAG: DUF6263 family protein [Moheibacter sp.]
MKKLSLLLLIISLFLGWGCSSSPEGGVTEQSIESAEGDKVLLRLKPKVGDSQKTMMSMDMTSGGQQPISMNMVMAMDLKVTGINESIYDYEIKYNSIQMDMDAGGMEMSYDSNNQEQTGMGQVMHDQMKSLLEKPMTMKMTDRGKVYDFEIPGLKGNQQLDLGAISIPMPEDPVGVGDSWSGERPIEGAGTMKMTMTVSKITVDDITIATKGTIEGTGGELAGDFTGEYKLARSNGFTKDGTVNINLSAQGQPIQMRINFKSL